VAASLPATAMENMKNRMRPQMVDMMVDQHLVLTRAKAKNITVSDADLDAKIDEIAKQNKITLDDIKADLAKSEMTMEEFREQMRVNVTLEKLLAAEMAGKVEAVDDAAAKKYYDENPDRFKQQEQVRASHILIKTEGLDEAGKAEAKTKIEDILKKVKEGGDFAELAKTHSGCPSSAQGGDLGYFERGRMVPEFSDAAFAMKVGEISNVVQTTFGYHIIKVTDHKAGGSQSFDEVKEGIKTFLKQKQDREFWGKFRQELRDAAKIEYDPEIRQALDKLQAKPVAPQPVKVEPAKPAPTEAPKPSEEKPAPK